MRHVTKAPCTHPRLLAAHANPPSDAESASRRWRNLGEKDRLLNGSLKPEQHHLCCYSEADAEALQLGFHIEHVANKSQHPERTFDYNNLLASAFNDAEGLATAASRGVAVFGGHASGKQGKPHPVNMALFVSPLQRDCARFFAYLSSGEVEPHVDLDPADKARARYTIDLLNLNSPYLIGLRQQWWDELDAAYQDNLSRQWDLDHLAAVDLTPRGDRLSPFFSLTRQFYGGLAERVIRTRAPQLI
jgi:uncharacterized protein (TIGR02646 family)